MKNGTYDVNSKKIFLSDVSKTDEDDKIMDYKDGVKEVEKVLKDESIN